MSFTKRTTFTDKLDEEIYCFRLMLKLAEECIGKSTAVEFIFKGHDVEIESSSKLDDVVDHRFMVRVRIQGVGKFDTCEVAGESYLDIMNCWLDSRAMIVRDPASRYFGKFSLTNGEDEYSESDELLDSYMEGGVNNMPEHIYFQESLVRDDYMYPFEDIDRLLDALCTESTITGSFFHHKIPGWTAEDYHELYDAVMENCHETTE